MITTHYLVELLPVDKPFSQNQCQFLDGSIFFWYNTFHWCSEITTDKAPCTCNFWGCTYGFARALGSYSFYNNHLQPIATKTRIIISRPKGGCILHCTRSHYMNMHKVPGKFESIVYCYCYCWKSTFEWFWFHRFWSINKDSLTQMTPL